MFSQICLWNIMTIDHLFLKFWSKNQFQMINLGFCSDNPGKNGWDTLSDLGEEETLFPWHNVDPSHVVRNLARSPNIGLMGAGKDYGKSKNPPAFY